MVTGFGPYSNILDELNISHNNLNFYGLVDHEEMEKLIAKDYSSSDLKTYFNSNSNIRFLDDWKYLLKIKVESVDPFTTLEPEPYPTKQSEDRLLKKITISAVALEDAQYPDKARQVDIVRFISPWSK